MTDRAGLLENSQYQFLKNNGDLKNILYLVLSGSYGYGTNTAASDIDLRGFLVEDKKYIFGLKPFEQFEDRDTDTVIYSAKKFIRLCIDGNPNALELLGVDEDCIVIMTDAGKKIRDSSHLFLSKRIIHSFGNYAMAQLRRLQNALCHDSYGEEEKANHLKNTLNAQMDHFKNTYTNFKEGAIEIDTGKDNILKLNIDLKNYPINEFTGIFSELNAIVKTYNKLNHRNNKKDESHLYKHAMHLIRLLMTGTDILLGSGIQTKRAAEHQLLMDIRNGGYTFDEIFSLANEFQRKFDGAAATTALPDRVDGQRIENLLIALYSRFM